MFGSHSRPLQVASSHPCSQADQVPGGAGGVPGAAGGVVLGPVQSRRRLTAAWASAGIYMWGHTMAQPCALMHATTASTNYPAVGNSFKQRQTSPMISVFEVKVVPGMSTHLSSSSHLRHPGRRQGTTKPGQLKNSWSIPGAVPGG